MVWFVCRMRLWHMCTFASENLTVKGLIKYDTYDLQYSLKPASHSFKIFLKEAALLDRFLMGEWQMSCSISI